MSVMKLKNIFFAGLALASFSACEDYLDVELYSKYDNEFVYSKESEMERALNGVYAAAIVNDLYGNAYMKNFNLNSDVDIAVSSSNSHAHNGYSRFDCDAQGGEILKFWTAAYAMIECANRFISGVEMGPLYDTSNGTIMQWIGEAKCLRAMAYHDLVVMFGDVPFTFVPAELRSEYIFDVVDRQTIQDSLIADLKEASLYMASTNSVTVEHCSKEFAQGLIARIALTAGGYSLRPDASNSRSYGKMERPDNYKDYYEIARAYSDSVISANTHSLKALYQNVFVNECNYQVVNDDDPIFEIPFAKNSTGNFGYLQGPVYKAYEGETVGPWGECDGTSRLNAFYRYSFRDKDLRREFVNGMWNYNYFTQADGTMADSVYILNDYYLHNNKWSKLWTATSSALGATTTGATGINYPYMRYADILLMYAEADNELNDGPTAKAADCLAKVHNRAFETAEDDYITSVQTDKETFLKAVLNERKWEFAGENSRWRDLVRTNTYGEELVYSFLRYYSVGMQNVGSTSGYEDAINAHDGLTYIDCLPGKIYYHTYRPTEDINAKAFLLPTIRAQFYGCYVNSTTRLFVTTYPNTTLQSLRICNAYKSASQPTKSAITNYNFAATEWYSAQFYQWGNENTGLPKDQCKYSFYGYVRCDDAGNLWLIDNGALKQLPSTIPTSDQLPVVRYILPYPNEVIQRSGGRYKNAYGY